MDQTPPLLKFKRLPLADGLNIPTYITTGAAGMDVCAAENTGLRERTTKAVHTGFAVEVPPGHELQVRSRSGLAAKHGVFVTNGPGTIDEDYRGEIMVILSNLGHEDYLIKRGDRIAQLVLVPVVRAEVLEVPELSITTRDIAGLGSTGVR